MDTVIKILGIVFVAVAIVYFIKPTIVNRIFEFFKKGSRVYLAAPIRLALAIVFLVGAGKCKQPWVIIVLGILLLLSAILVLVLGPKKLRPMIEWFQKKSNLFARLMALIILAIGVVIILCA